MKRQREEDSYGYNKYMDIPERVSVAVCVFCRQARPEVTFVSEEHIVPESIGNTDNRLIIPPGTVCDPCNHEELANLDRILLDFLPIKLTRVIGRIPNKSDAYPSLSSANSVTIKGDADTVHLNLPNRRFGKITTNDAGVEITFSVQDAKMTDARKVLLARALFKIVFECMVHKYGVTWALCQPPLLANTLSRLSEAA